MGAAERLQGRRFISVEFMYKPRPTEPFMQKVFDYALEARLRELDRRTPDSAVVFLCADDETIDSLRPFEAAFPNLTHVFAITNPRLIDSTKPDPQANTPTVCGWDDPNTWRRYAMTDRWSRILWSLELGAHFAAHPGWIVMPSLDAVWGVGLIEHLARLSVAHVEKGVPAAVSPYTPKQHSDLPGANIPHLMINAINAAFGRDFWLRRRIESGRYQAFWGKMGKIPFAMCEVLRAEVDTRVWEDDLEIDRVIRKLGYGVSCEWIADASVYRQLLPVNVEEGVRRVIDRTLHYSLNIPGSTLGDQSLLKHPLALPLKARRLLDIRYRRALDLAERLTDESLATAADRIARTGMSWVDWGAYRHVVSVGDPFVQVWKRSYDMI